MATRELGATARADPAGAVAARIAVGLVFLLALLVRVAYLVEIQGTPLTRFLLLDAATYDRFARAILAGTFHGEEIYSMNALYPYIVAAVYKVAGAAPVAVCAVQAVVDALTCALAAALGARLFGWRAGAVAGGALALCAPLVFYTGALLTPTWIVFFTLVGALALVHALAPPTGGARWAALAGLALGLATLVRGNNLLFLPAGLAIVLARRGARGGLGAGLAFVLAFVAPVAALVARDFALAGHWVPVAANYAAFYVGHNPAATGLYVRPPWIQGGEFQDEVWGVRDAVARQVGHPVTLAESARWLFAQGVAYACTHPAAELGLLWTKLRCFASGIESPTNLNLEFARDWSPLLRRAPIGSASLFVVGVAGAWRLRERARAMWPLYAGVAVPLLTCLAVFVASEYRVAALPFLALLGAGGFLAPSRDAGWRRDRGGVAVILGALLVFSALAPGVLRAQADKSGDDVNFATLYARHDEWVAARILYERGVRQDPRNGYAWRGLAVALDHLGDAAGAARAEAAARRLGALP